MLWPICGDKDSASNNSSLRTEGTQNNLFFKSIKGKDPPGKLCKPFPNRNNCQTFWKHGWIVSFDENRFKLQLRKNTVNRLKESKILAIRKNPQVLQNSYNAQIKYTWVSWGFSVSEGHTSKFISFWHPHCQPLPCAHRETWAIKSMNLVVEVLT